jgi:hypothetical protein
MSVANVIIGRYSAFSYYNGAVPASSPYQANARTCPTQINRKITILWHTWRMDEDQLFLRPAKSPAAGISEDEYRRADDLAFIEAQLAYGLSSATERPTENELSDFSRLWHDGCGKAIIEAQNVDQNHSAEV